MSKMRFSKINCIYCFCPFYVGEIETEKKKTKWKRPKNPIRIVLFKVVIQRCEKIKNGFLANLPDTICVRKGEQCIFVHTICFGPIFLTKTVQTRKHYKNSGFNGNCPKPKMTPLFWEKVSFDMGERVGFTNCVFEKVCFSQKKHYFIVFSAKHSSCNKKLCVERNRKFMKNCGLFLNMPKWCFGGCLFFRL